MSEKESFRQAVVDFVRELFSLDKEPWLGGFAAYVIAAVGIFTGVGGALLAGLQIEFGWPMLARWATYGIVPPWVTTSLAIAAIAMGLAAYHESRKHARLNDLVARPRFDRIYETSLAFLMGVTVVVVIWGFGATRGLELEGRGMADPSVMDGWIIFRAQILNRGRETSILEAGVRVEIEESRWMELHCPPFRSFTINIDTQPEPVDYSPVLVTRPTRIPPGDRGEVVFVCSSRFPDGGQVEWRSLIGSQYQVWVLDHIRRERASAPWPISSVLTCPELVTSLVGPTPPGVEPFDCQPGEVSTRP